MKKIFLWLAALSLTLGACSSLSPQAQPAASPAPAIQEADIQATVAVQVEQTVASLPTPTLLPSGTPFVITATSAPTNTQQPPTSTVTQEPTQPTLTAALSTGSAVAAATGTLPAATTPLPTINTTPTGTSHYQYYGTMPPDLPSGNVTLFNKSKLEAYISLQCTTKDGYSTVIEYPVGGSTINTKAPAGQYFYVVWVGGEQFTGSFRLDKLQDKKIFMYKNRVEVK